MTMADLTETELEGFEYHGCSSGTSTSSMVRDAIVRAVAEIRRHRAARAADEDRVRSVVREAVLHVVREPQFFSRTRQEAADIIADIAAKQLAGSDGLGRER